MAKIDSLKLKSFFFDIQNKYYQLLKFAFNKEGWQTLSQIKKPDDLQSIANLIRFFAYAWQALAMIGIRKKFVFM